MTSKGEDICPEMALLLTIVAALPECSEENEPNARLRDYKTTQLNGEEGEVALLCRLAVVQVMLIVLSRSEEAVKIGKAFASVVSQVPQIPDNEMIHERLREEVIATGTYALLLNGNSNEAHRLMAIWGDEEFGWRSRSSKKDLERDYKWWEKNQDLDAAYGEYAEDLADAGSDAMEVVCGGLTVCYADHVILSLGLAGAKRLARAGITIERVNKVIPRLEGVARRLLTARG